MATMIGQPMEQAQTNIKQYAATLTPSPRMIAHSWASRGAKTFQQVENLGEKMVLLIMNALLIKSIGIPTT